LFVLNTVSTLAAIATTAITWDDNRTLAWLAIGAMVAATVLGRLTPLFYMAGIVAGPGLLAYAISDSGIAGLLTSLVVTLMFYVFSWQVRKHSPTLR
jgi:hypothetical protein